MIILICDIKKNITVAENVLAQTCNLKFLAMIV
jgi:hypothetical protein